MNIMKNDKNRKFFQIRIPPSNQKNTEKANLQIYKK